MGMETGLTSVLSARVWVAEQWDISWKVAGEQRDPLKSPRQITYSWAIQKYQVFPCPAATPSPVQGRSLPRLHISPCCTAGTHCPPWIGSWGSLTSLENTPSGDARWSWNPVSWGVSAAHGAARGSCSACTEADISQGPVSGWGPGCTHRRGTEHGSLGCVSPSWHQPWSILMVHLAQQAWKASSTRELRAGEVGFRREQHSRLLRSSGIFQSAHTGPCHSPMLILHHLPSLFLDLSLGSSVHISKTQLRSWAELPVNWRGSRQGEVLCDVSPTPAGQSLQHLW